MKMEMNICATPEKDKEKQAAAVTPKMLGNLNKKFSTTIINNLDARLRLTKSTKTKSHGPTGCLILSINKS